MTDERWKKIEDLFDEVLDLDSNEREARLRAAGEREPAIAAEVRAMLAAHERVGGVLDQAAPGSEIDVLSVLSEALADRYSIVREIGRGGMARVFLARELKHQRNVVLKVLRPDRAAALGARRFLREVRIAAQLSHPHVLGLIDSGEAGGLLFYAMPYVGGETLRARLRSGALPLNDALPILRDIADALATAHRQGIVHRDLKPENVLCVGRHAFLMDFGIAKLLADDPSDRLTMAGTSVGTPIYMAPEQHEGDPDLDHRADLFAWGLVAWETLTGVDPSRRGKTGRPSAEVRDLPEPLDSIVAACLAADPADRPPSADVIIATLDSLGPHQVAAQPRPRRRILALALGTAAILAALSLLRPDPAPLESARSPLPQPVVVAVLDNATGDSTLSTWGRLAGDWLTQALQETGRVSVVPWPEALQASERLAAQRTSGQSLSPVTVLQEETGAGSVVTGSYYLVDNTLHFQLNITDARTGRLLGAPQQVSAPRDSLAQVIQLLRERLMGTLAVLSDERYLTDPGLDVRPPTYSAYRSFDRGMQLHVQQRYADAAVEFTEAFRLDTTFVVPLVYLAFEMLNTDNLQAADSVVREIRARALGLSRYHEFMVSYIDAILQSDGERALRMVTEAARESPGARAYYDGALAALTTNRPDTALALLGAIDPDHGSMRGWASYWTQLSHALHLLEMHHGELDAARAMRQRHPDSRVAWILEARALAALGRIAELDSLLSAAAPLPPNAYWSQGAAMVVAGEELIAHGDSLVGADWLERGISWLANQLAMDPSHRPHRYWMGSALYDAGRWREATPYFVSLTDDFPERITYRGLAALVAARAGDTTRAHEILGEAPRFRTGEHTTFLARMAAVTGDTARATALLSEALRQGVDGFPWLHASARADFVLMLPSDAFARVLREPRH